MGEKQAKEDTVLSSLNMLLAVAMLGVALPMMRRGLGDGEMTHETLLSRMPTLRKPRLDRQVLLQKDEKKICWY